MRRSVSEITDTPERSRFFGRSKGKKLRQVQSAVFEELLPKLLITLDTLETTLPETFLNSLFSFTPTELRMEIGFGGGEHLLKRALENPTVGFIGCEPFVNGMAKLLMEIDRLGVQNIKVYNNDATKLLRRWPKSSITAIDLLYPDPWPKRKQRKRRFVSDESLELLAAVIKPGCPFRFASDIDNYVGWTLQRILASNQWDWPSMNAADWLQPYDGWIRTRYEAKAIEEGRTPAYLTFFRSRA
jgi:tRNA (guanine-N7-)-methyltransferase